MNDFNEISNYNSSPAELLESLSNKYNWISDMKQTPQDPIWHGEGSVFVHTRMVLETLITDGFFNAGNTFYTEEEKQIMFAAALLHDVEKRSTTFEEDGRIVSPGHAKKGEKTARQILYRDIPTPFVKREKIAKIVRHHGLPLWLMEKENPEKSIIEASFAVDLKLVQCIAEADVNGRICPDGNELFYKIDLFKEMAADSKCWSGPRKFNSDLARFTYFDKEDSHPDYEPYDTTWNEVIIMCGMPGSGKDYYIKHSLPDYPMLSLDEIRREMKIKAGDVSGTGQVIQAAKEKAKSYLRKKQPFIWNGTNVTRQVRQQPISLCASYGAKVKLIYLEVPYAKVLHQNKDREFPIKEDVLEKFINKLEIPSIYEAHEVDYIIDGKSEKLCNI